MKTVQNFNRRGWWGGRRSPCTDEGLFASFDASKQIGITEFLTKILIAVNCILQVQA